MNDTSYPVTILVQRPDGSKEEVRVGTAVRTADGFRLTLGELAIGAAPDRAMPAAAPARRPAGSSSGDGAVFPPYGRSKGLPIAGASVQDLEFYIQGSRRSLDDPSKSRFHEKERVLLAAMEAELSRQKGGGGGERRPPDRASADRGPSERGAGERSHEDFGGFDGPSPFSDDDIPF